MSVGLGLEGAWANTTISEKDIQTIKSASDRDHIGNVAGRLWDKIADWFSGTDRAGAKKLVFDLYSPSVTDRDKIESFQLLREKVGAKYKDEFHITRFGNVDTFKLLDFKLDVINERIDYQRAEVNLHHYVERTLHKPIDEKIHQFAKDFHRKQEDGFTINSEPVAGMEAFEQFTDHEKTAIFAICHQGLYQEIASGIPCPSTNQKMSFDVTKADSGALVIKFHHEKDIAMDFDEHCFQDLEQQVSSNVEIPKSTRTSAEIQVSFDRDHIDLSVRDAEHMVNYDLLQV